MPRFSGSTASPWASPSPSASTVTATDWLASLPASASTLREVQWLFSSSSATARIRLSAS